MSTQETEVIHQLRAIFQGRGLDAPSMSPTTALDRTLGLESLDFAELAVRLEGVYGRDPFSEPNVPPIQTIADLARLYVA